MAAIYQTAFSNAFSSIKMYEFRLRFHWSLFPNVQLTIFQHWFRLWLGTVQATDHFLHQWASYQIRNIAGYACVGLAGNVFSGHRLQRKPLVNDPGMHHGTCVTHVPWCMSGSLTGGGGENVPGIPGACANRNFTYLTRGPWCLV